MIDRMAHEIAERQKDLAGLALIGIRTRGVPLATRLASQLSGLVKQTFPVGTLDITLYRDDLSTVAPQPLLKKTEIDFDLNGRTVVLCDVASRLWRAGNHQRRLQDRVGALAWADGEPDAGCAGRPARGFHLPDRIDARHGNR